MSLPSVQQQQDCALLVTASHAFFAQHVCTPEYVVLFGPETGLFWEDLLIVVK